MLTVYSRLGVRMRWLVFFISISSFLGCSPYIFEIDPPLPSPVLRTPSGKIIESVLGNVILHEPPQNYFKFRGQDVSAGQYPGIVSGVEVTWVSPETKDIEVGDLIVGALLLPQGTEIEIQDTVSLQNILMQHLATGLQLLLFKKNTLHSPSKIQKQAVVLTPEKTSQGMEVLALEQAWDTTYLGIGMANLDKLPKNDRPRHLLEASVVLIWVSSNTLAARYGLMPLDVILEINNTPVKNCFQALNLIQKHNGEGTIHFKIRHPDFKVETIAIDLFADVNELVVRKIPAIYGVKYSQQEEASSFLGVYSGTRYSYQAPPSEDRSRIWDLAELNRQKSDILYQPQPEYFEEYYFRFPLFYSYRKTTSLKDHHGYKTHRILNLFHIDSQF